MDHHHLSKTNKEKNPVTRKIDFLSRASKFVNKLADLLTRIIIDVALVTFLLIAVWQIIKGKIGA